MDLKVLALDIATAAHAGQFDKGGKPYIDHPKKIAQEFKDTTMYIVALLHDVVEDTGITLKELRGYGFSGAVCAAIDAITKRQSENYNDYLNRVKENNIARAVKIVDLKHNSDLSRITEPTKNDYLRAEKYKQALCYLSE